MYVCLCAWACTRECAVCVFIDDETWHLVSHVVRKHTIVHANTHTCILIMCVFICMSSSVYAFLSPPVRAHGLTSGMEYLPLTSTHTQVCPLPDVAVEVLSASPVESIPVDAPVGLCYSTPVRPPHTNSSANAAVGQKKTPASASLPLPSGSSTPSPGSSSEVRGGDNSWVSVADVDWTTTLIEDFGLDPDREYSNCDDYCLAEWGIIEYLVFLVLRENPLHDCFWLFKDKTAIPVCNVRTSQKHLAGQWNQAHNACPPVRTVCSGKGVERNAYELSGFQYKCDHRIQTGCPCKLRCPCQEAVVTPVAYCLVHLCRLLQSVL